MAYEMVMPYHLHMPSYFLETFTELVEPTFSQFSKFMSVSKKDEVSAMRTLVKDCFIEGDHELVNNNFRFLFGLMGQLTDLLSPARARS